MIARLVVRNFLAIGEVEMELGPLTIICGPNWSGKTSLQQAIRLALTGEVARVEKKNEYRMLVRDGAKSAMVAATIGDQAVRAATLKAAPSGHQVPMDAVVHPYLLDMHRLSNAVPRERLAVIAEIMGVTPEPNDVAARMLARNVPPEAVEAIKPIIAAGWDAALQFAESKAKEARAEWKAATGEAYGSEKAEGWKAEPSVPEKSDELAAALDRNRQRLELAQKQHDDYEPEVRELEATIAQAGATFACPDCGTISLLVTPERVAEATAKLPQRQEALAILQRAIDSRRRDVQASEDAARAITTAEERANEVTAAARKAHEAVVQWTHAMSVLAPEGIPADMLRPKLAQVNERLAQSAEATGFGRVEIHADGAITNGGRPYNLLSEAEQWVTDAMLIEALCLWSGTLLVMLDRFDVLDLPKRAAALKWLRSLPQSPQVIIFATLKQRPTMAGATVYWIEKGQIVQPEEAAA